MKNNKFEIKRINTDSLLIVNSHNQEIQQNCNPDRIYQEGTYILKFQNCKIIINNLTFMHSESSINIHKTLPNSLKNITFEKENNFTLEEFKYENSKNIEELKQTHLVYSKAAVSSSISCIGIIILLQL